MTTAASPRHTLGSFTHDIMSVLRAAPLSWINELVTAADEMGDEYAATRALVTQRASELRPEASQGLARLIAGAMPAGADPAVFAVAVTVTRAWMARTLLTDHEYRVAVAPWLSVFDA